MGRVFTSSVVVTPAIDVDTTLWVQAVNGNGGSVSAARQTLINALIVGLKADGSWAELDELFLFAAENEPSALTGLIRRTLATNIDSTSFTVDQGYTGDGAADYIDTNFDPVSASPAAQFLQDDACLFAWSNTAGNASGTLVGQTSSILGGSFLNPEIIGNAQWRLNNTNLKSIANTGDTGLYLMNRSGAAALTLDKNGTQIDSDTDTSAALTSSNLCSHQSNGSSFSSRQISCMGFGGALTPALSAALYGRIRSYMSSIGVP